MRPSLALIAVLLVAALPVATAQAAPAKPQPLLVGAAEDAAKDGGAIGSDAKMNLAALAGFDTIRVTSIWRPGRGRSTPASRRRWRPSPTRPRCTASA